MGLLSFSYESCLWNQYYHVYKNLGDVCWNDEYFMQCLADVKIPLRLGFFAFETTLCNSSIFDLCAGQELVIQEKEEKLSDFS